MSIAAISETSHRVPANPLYPLTRSPRTDAGFAEELDQADDLAGFRQQFEIEDPELIYLDGNPLRRLPKRTLAFLEQALAVGWGRTARLHPNRVFEQLGAKTARLLGAQPEEVFIVESTSEALALLVSAALAMRPQRFKVLCDGLNSQIVEAVVRSLGQGHGIEWMESGRPKDEAWSHRLADRGDEANETSRGQEGAIALALDHSTALLCLSQVSFDSAFLHDMAVITDRAHDCGALALWDLSHSAGALPIDIRGCGIDLAVGRFSMDFLGAPDTPGFLYVRRDLQTDLLRPIRQRLNPRLSAIGADTGSRVRRFCLTAPAMLSMRALEPTLDLLFEAGVARLRAKSQRQTQYLIYLVRKWLEPLSFNLMTSCQPELRGAHVALAHIEAHRIRRCLMQPNSTALRVIPDLRRRDLIHLGVASLYTSFREIHRAVGRLRQVAAEREYERYERSGGSGVELHPAEPAMRRA